MTEAKQVEADFPETKIRVRLKPGREKPLLRGSAWVFSGAIEEVDGGGEAGISADVFDAEGEWLGRGLWHPAADMSVRMFTQDPRQAMDEAFFRGAVRRAVALRHRLFGPPNEWRDTNAVRLVFSEADGLSGLVADQYAGVVALQVGSKVWEPWLPAVIDELKREAGADAVTVRADSDAIQREGLTNDLGGDPAPERVVIQENGYSFEVGLTGGQKTGFYLDQRDNRRKVAAYARGRDVLSAYCYTGAFEVCAAHAGATKITGWDSSEAALVQARRHHELNPSGVPAVYEVADVPRRLRLARDRREAWDLIILDPPRMVTRRDGLEKGLRAYKDVNLLAIKLLRPGGILATFSCSGLVDMNQFRKTVGWAAHDSGRRVRILEMLGQPPDHPVPLEAPECEYLKGLICVVD
ncbi:MAG TPA: class I SAM-dependent rRNA methyltransferase [Kiritimatiellia bacterium]|nr:class I SAM-dependent rRNA methyltransferase [Lentisphaerota bacterium]HPC19909.1 class I SAM-dependent rRNA methyltransferase [Kiritimatiellia bacterium]HQN80376.1 class I SAM-dependent rRNA methyltransferase [Kiritimatiellia bacterium]HQQ60410.1 class I SAM-dependent rRNA methyltransferase [Kiritimatiellia bacterium]